MSIEEASEKKYPYNEWSENKGIYCSENDIVDYMRAAFIAGSKYGKEWISEKPEFKEECLLIAASFIREGWDYNLFEIRKAEVEDKWYWGVFQDGDEWGDIADLKAQKYLVIQLLK